MGLRGKKGNMRYVNEAKEEGKAEGVGVGGKKEGVVGQTPPSGGGVVL